MEHQYSVVETPGQNVGDDYANQNIVSLFGWGCTGFQDTQYNHNQTFYMPYNTGADNYSGNNGSLYGPSGLESGHYNLQNLSVERMSDWGYVANQAQLNGYHSGWRTLSSAEWSYLFWNRKVIVNSEQKDSYGEAIVEGVKGFVFLPDNWDGSICQSFIYGNTTSWNVFNSTTSPTWEAMESAGAVFLPCVGMRNGTNVYGPNDATYWSSSYYDDPWGAKILRFNIAVSSSYSCEIYPDNFSRQYGAAVRLVRDVD